MTGTLSLHYQSVQSAVTNFLHSMPGAIGHATVVLLGCCQAVSVVLQQQEWYLKCLPSHCAKHLVVLPCLLVTHHALATSIPHQASHAKLIAKAQLTAIRPASLHALWL